MPWNPTYKPSLRPVEAFHWDGEDGDVVGLRDATGLSEVVLSMSEPVLMALSLMDGETTCQHIQQHFLEQTGQALSTDTMQSLLAHLNEAHFLDGPDFENHYQNLVNEYLAQDARTMPSAPSLGIEESGEIYKEMLDQAVRDTAADATPTGKIRGIVAPHLDYPRGRPCYAKAYGSLQHRPLPDRVIILGTNHFGRSTSIVSTGQHFQTPLGMTRVDGDFLSRLEKKCGGLRTFEMDHAREHSIELQVAWLQYLYGAENFEIVPFLCPDPSMETHHKTTSNGDVTCAHFADALREEIDLDPGDTLIVAGADLSHVGSAFGEDGPLTYEFLASVENKDRQSLDCIVSNSSEAFVQSVARDENNTRVCSAGCMSVISRALSDTHVSLLGYHQAVDQDTQTCVTCCALLFA